MRVITVYNKIYNEDCLQGLGKLTAKSVDLAIYDAPYYSTGIAAVGDTQWKTEDAYIEWCMEVIKQTERVMRENGSFYWFHNDVNIMVEILHRIKRETSFKLKNQITWDKLPTHNNFSRVVKTYGKNRRYGQTFTEYIYYFTLQEDRFHTPFSRVMLEQMTKQGIRQKEIASLQLSRTGKITGWVPNKLKGVQIPTEEQWVKICGLFGIPNNYAELLEQYQQER